MNAWCKLKRPGNIHDCAFHQSQVFKQNITTQISCHSKLHTIHNLKRNNHVGANTFSREPQICFLLNPTRTLTPWFSFLQARLVDLLLRAPWPKNKRFIREHIVDASTYFKLLSIPLPFKNFVWVATPTPY